MPQKCETPRRSGASRNSYPGRFRADPTPLAALTQFSIEEVCGGELRGAFCGLSPNAALILADVLSSPSGRRLVVLPRSSSVRGAFRTAVDELSRVDAPIKAVPIYWPVRTEYANDGEAAGGGIDIWELRAVGHAAETFSAMRSKYAQRWGQR